MKNVIGVFGIVLSLLAGNLAQAAQPADLGLTQIKDSRSRVAYLKADQDFSQYDSVTLVEIMTDDVQVEEPTRSRIRRNDWEMDEERQQRIKEMHARAFEREFAELKDLKVTNVVSANTLVLVSRLVEVAPTVGYDPGDLPGRTRVYSSSTGSATIEMILLDGATGEVVGMVANARELGGHFWSNNNRVTNGADAQFAFNIWAKQARKALEQLPEMAAEARS